LVIALIFIRCATASGNVPGNWPLVKFDNGPVTVRFPNDYFQTAAKDGTLITAPSEDSPIVLRLTLQDIPAGAANPSLGHEFVRHLADKKKLKPRALGNKLFITERAKGSEPNTEVQFWVIGFDDAVVVLSATIQIGTRDSPAVRECLQRVLPRVIESLAKGDSRQVGDRLVRRGQADVIIVDDDHEPINRAIQQARATVNQFISALNSPTPAQKSFSVKMLVTDGTHGEHIWVAPVRHEQGKFVGQINNTPDRVRGVKIGDEISTPQSEISDWMYVDGNRLMGGFTIRVLRDGLSDAEKRQFDRSMPFRIE